MGGVCGSDHPHCRGGFEVVSSRPALASPLPTTLSYDKIAVGRAALPDSRSPRLASPHIPPPSLPLPSAVVFAVNAIFPHRSHHRLLIIPFDMQTSSQLTWHAPLAKFKRCYETFPLPDGLAVSFGQASALHHPLLPAHLAISVAEQPKRELRIVVECGPFEDARPSSSQTSGPLVLVRSETLTPEPR